jgi:ribonuclease-3 family protein
MLWLAYQEILGKAKIKIGRWSKSVSEQEEEKINSSQIWAATGISQLRSLGDEQLEQLQQISVAQLSPTALAYLGDAVYELYVRTCYLLPPKRSQVYHEMVVAQVRAESQARSLLALQPYLTSTELEILRRGRNAAARRPRRVAPEIYQQATSLETLMGYLYLTDPKRLTQLLAHLKLDPIP